MACSRCGCRMPARRHPRSSRLVCADCGTALPPVSGSARRHGWLAFAAVSAAALATTTLVIVSGLNQDGPTLADRQQEARLSDAGADE